MLTERKRNPKKRRHQEASDEKTEGKGTVKRKKKNR